MKQISIAEERMEKVKRALWQIFRDMHAGKYDKVETEKTISIEANEQICQLCRLSLVLPASRVFKVKDSGKRNVSRSEQPRRKAA